jgi:2-dehydro-3-deoxyphosphogluconate aldolase/(4S)-4-hydroxy-2-oxoglutarate aldolase
MTPQESSKIAAQICGLAPVVPVLVVKDVAHARPLAEALVAGGLPALEVTLRTPAALEVIAEMAKVEGGVVGAGTLLTAQDVTRAKAAGAKFGVSPGFTDALLTACEEQDMPILAGTASCSEVMQLLERGYTTAKFFPAETNGGAPAVKNIGGPLPQMMLCPTGGIDLEKAKDYLKLSNTMCVGGSWVAPAALVEKGDWKAIEELAREAAALTA